MPAAHELNNVYANTAYASTPLKLKAELHRLKREMKDEDQFADEVPKDSP